MPGDETIAIQQLLGDAGYSGPAATRARQLLEEAKLTRSGKRGIAAYKRDQAVSLLARRLARACCAECAGLLDEGREPVLTTTANACELCGGSNNRRAARAAVRAMERAGINRVLVVGGAPGIRTELAALWQESEVALEFVDGTSTSHSQRDAIARMNRVQLVVIWGSTELRHAVSELYTRNPPPGLRMITVGRRSIEALCREVERSMSGGRAAKR